MVRNAALLALTLAAICSRCTCSEDLCVPGMTTCFDDYESVLVCSDDGQRWATEPCPEGKICFRGNCHALTCVPDLTQCSGNAVVQCKDDGSDWGEPKECSGGTVCDQGECREVICEPDTTRCRDNVVERCEVGTRWSDQVSCLEQYTCTDGICLSDSCEQGQTECGRTTLYTCEQGSWVTQECPEGEMCLFGTCLECVGADSCQGGEVCSDGHCQYSVPRIVTQNLATATVGLAYQQAIEVEQGTEPFTWSVDAGDLPDGLQLADGLVSGTPTSAGTYTFTLLVTDDNAQSDSRVFVMEVYADGPLQIVTTSLPEAEHGVEYSFQLEATGGANPYAWQVLEGALPAGMTLFSSGGLGGVPDEIGSFMITFRVFDATTPPDYESRELELVVQIAPLEIIGEQEINLILTKVIVLSTLVPYIPYSNQLQAKGGLRPYTWEEQADPPPGLGWLIQNWGFPEGLTLEPDGTVSGWVTDVSDATQISIPFGPELTGYFVYIGVTDSQNPAEQTTAIFSLPTVSIAP